jgi:hypothetical protein
MKTYIEVGHDTYGSKCEWIGCEWDAAQTDVHHINYQEHQEQEDGLRKTLKAALPISKVRTQ